MPSWIRTRNSDPCSFCAGKNSQSFGDRTKLSRKGGNFDMKPRLHTLKFIKMPRLPNGRSGRPAYAHKFEQLGQVVAWSAQLQYFQTFKAEQSPTWKLEVEGMINATQSQKCKLKDYRLGPMGSWYFCASYAAALCLADLSSAWLSVFSVQRTYGLHSLLRTENDLLSRNLQRQDCSRFCCLLLSFVSLSVFTPLRGAHQDQNERFACSSQCHAVLGVSKPFVLQHLWTSINKKHCYLPCF